MWSNFRQALRDIRYALARIPSGIPKVFLSATVPPTERNDIVAVHGERRATLFSMPTVRKNLEFSVFRKDLGTSNTGRSSGGRYTDAQQEMLQATVNTLKQELEKISRSEMLAYGTDGEAMPFFRVLVYVMQRKNVEQYADVLSTSYLDVFSFITDADSNLDLKVSVLQYHAAMDSRTKEKMYEVWRTPKCARTQEHSSRSVRIVVMVSTCAFGAGIDASNVRLVLHVGGSTSLKDYAQKAGRAGRDGQ
ncbi:ATP-dependent DNA helicase RecQ family [Gracilaria domingensis]|nr:ATP-dependent DNA helicase RecQ family [Gracilaria domingensis]